MQYLGPGPTELKKQVTGIRAGQLFLRFRSDLDEINRPRRKLPRSVS
jgi:hypothetical protein